MKRITFFAFACLAIPQVLFAQAVYTKPAGYVTLNLKPGFNLVGMQLVESEVKIGTFTSNTATTLVDSNANFVLESNTAYLIELTGGSLAGGIIEAQGSAFSGTTISGLSGITADYLATYSIRPAKTIAQIFGTGNDVLLAKGSSSTADAIYVPKTGGGFDTYYHTQDQVISGTTYPGGWRQVGVSGDKANTFINYLDGFYIQIRTTEKNLVITGNVKTSSSLLPASEGFSYFSSIYPAGTTLDNSGLASSVLKGSSSTADLIFLPKLSGGFDTFYHTQDQVISGTTYPGGWRQVGVSGDKKDQVISSGFLFQRRGVSTNLPLSPPSSYSSL